METEIKNVNINDTIISFLQEYHNFYSDNKTPSDVMVNDLINRIRDFRYKEFQRGYENGFTDAKQLKIFISVPENVKINTLLNLNGKNYVKKIRRTIIIQNGDKLWQK